ncbi:hypothetical protein [uncultured Microscilla sp.]|uniref:hypothetical protein n=1 Tax=uncultured Microscilla sp. TaxID=432653 RepID=UPI002624444C|nr:hypothetical protein [uncultured Microscilla sp.]
MGHLQGFKHIIKLITLWVVFPLMAGAQTPPVNSEAIDEILQRTQKFQIEKYQFPKVDTGYIKLRMAFDKFEAINPKALARLRKQKIFAIDLVYTQFPKKRSFDTLNRKRLANLQQYLPLKIQDSEIAWRHFGQNSCNTYAEAYQLFHGLVVYFYPLKDTINAPLVDIGSDNPELVLKPDTVPVVANPKYDFTNLPLLDAQNIDYSHPRTFYQIAQQKYLPEDSTVFKVFERNRWDSMLVVVDWTGSMYHHGAQLLVWMEVFHQQKNRLRSFVFFNDGDGKTLGEKVMGHTGGLHYASAQSLDVVIGAMHKAEKSGKGDDTPENDIEALIKGIRRFPDCKEVILIADASSQIRDYPLLKELVRLKRPIRVILCGKEMMPDYILLAYYTNGSLHTIDQDIIEMQTKLRNGEEVEVGNTLVKIKKKRFHMKLTSPRYKKRKRRRKK